jgi:fructose-bisphosphate aldolase, class II
VLIAGRDLLALTSAGRAIGSFNTYNLEVTRAILRAAEAKQAPVFLAVGRGALDAAGFGPLAQAMLAAAREASVPVAVHLDHSPDVPTATRCIETGFTSVMIDGSSLPFDANLELTRAAITATAGATIEAELGGIPGDEDRATGGTATIPMTDPDQATRFVEQTGVESLAVAIGNAHGLCSGEPKLDFDRLAALRDAVPVPLVLHGASGIADADIRQCIDLGVRKINVNTEIRVAFFESLESSLAAGVKGYDVIRLMNAAVAAMQAVVEEKLTLFAGG